MNENVVDTSKNKNNVLKGIIAITIYIALYFGPILYVYLSQMNNKILSSLSIIAYPFFLIYSLIFSIFTKFNDKVLIFNIVYDLLIIFIIYSIFNKEIKEKFKDFIKNAKAYLKKYIKYWFITLLLMEAANMIIIFIKGDIAANEQAVRALVDQNKILTIILSCVLAPFLEESIYRLSLFKIIGKHKYLFIVLSGLLFGCAHVLDSMTTLSDLLYIIPYGIPGSVFAYTLIKSNNIFVPISLHTIHNTFALLLQLLLT